MVYINAVFHRRTLSSCARSKSRRVLLNLLMKKQITNKWRLPSVLFVPIDLEVLRVTLHYRDLRIAGMHGREARNPREEAYAVPPLLRALAREMMVIDDVIAFLKLINLDLTHLTHITDQRVAFRHVFIR